MLPQQLIPIRDEPRDAIILAPRVKLLIIESALLQQPLVAHDGGDACDDDGDCDLCWENAAYAPLAVRLVAV